MADGRDSKSFDRAALDKKVLLTKEEYELKYGDYNRQRDRERNLLLLMRLRPGVFTPDEQTEYEFIKQDITSTAWLALGGFLSMSCVSYWQLKTNSKSAAFGIAAIFASYAPAMVYYKWQISKETLFARNLSEKYRDRIDDSKLQAFIGAIPQDSSVLPFSGPKK